MREPRNPFRLRRAESIDTDAVFLGLFEPGILDVVPTERWCENVHVLRSAAGGGKTTLLRLFTPSVLLTLHSRRSEPQLKELYQRMQDLGAVDDSGPKVLGVMLLCGRNYAMLQDLDLEQSRRDRLFFGLLNARIILAVLRSAMSVKKLEYPNDLERLRVASLADGTPPRGLKLPCTGKELFDWAGGLEAKVCESLDSFGPLKPESLPGDESLLSLTLLRPEALTVDGSPVAERTLLMMDDIHKLTSQQRERLIQTVIELRSPVGIWIAERFEALNTEEMLASGTNEGRDYEKPIELEWFWRTRYQRFEKLALQIADRRVRAAAETELASFRPCLVDSLDDPAWEPVFARACNEIAGRVRTLAQNAERFKDWLAAREKMEGTPRERAVAWRALEILMLRELNRPQKGLFDEATPLQEDELNDKDDSKVNQAAELFLAREYELPYYFGPGCLSRLASLNIQQFLGLAGDVFEEVVAAELLKKPHFLSPVRQHALMKKAAKAMWDDIPKRVRYGRELRNFLEAIGKFSEWYTYRPTAPNDPGVGGTAIRMSDRASLMDEAFLRTRPDQKRFASIVASALAHNLLVADLDYPCKGQKWMVLNLNRLLCVHFNLPLGYGLYKERPVSTLCQWLDQPFIAPAAQESML
jgi:hypothetical protein